MDVGIDPTDAAERWPHSPRVSQTRFAVWAPFKKTVELVLDDSTHEMSMDEHGWWTATVEAATRGTRYRFRVDGEGPFPDPRSPWQPEGVHGPSESVDHSTFAWHDHAFVPKSLSDAVLYELHVGTFSEEGTYEVPRATCLISSSWGSPTWSSCRSGRFPATTAGGTTAPRCSRRTPRTERRISSRRSCKKRIGSVSR